MDGDIQQTANRVRPVGVVAAPGSPRAVPAPRSGRPGAAVVLSLWLAPLVTAGLLWLSFFPADVGWLGWFALVPLLMLVRCPARPSLVYLSALLGGMAFYVPALQWLRVADWRMMVFAWPGVALGCTVYLLMTLFFVRFLDRRTRLPLVLTLPVVWTAVELLRSSLAGGFSWYLLGHTQHAFLPVIQFADVTGAYGVSFLVAAVNAVLFETLYARRWFGALCGGPDAPRRWKPTALLAQAVVVAAAFLAALAYGGWRLGQNDFTPGPRIALVQGNVPQQIRNDVNVAEILATHYFALCDLAGGQKTDLIVWPETSFPLDWQEVAPDVPAERIPESWKTRLAGSLNQANLAHKRWHGNILIGQDACVLEADGRERRYNSAVLIDRGGRPAGRYGKMHCVPFGEYVPFRDVLPFMQYLAPYDGTDYSVTPGRDTTHFPLDADGGKYTFGVVICYEDTDPERARPYAGGDGRPPVDFLLNISNDGWFDGTCEHDEHLAVCRFRAIECRRSVGRAVNMGVSALVDPNGRVLAPQPVAGAEWDDPRVRKAIQDSLEILRPDEYKVAIGLFPTDHAPAVWLASSKDGVQELPPARWAEYKKVAGVLLADVPIDHRFSLYAHLGDWLPWACWLTLGGCAAVAFVRRRQGGGMKDEG